MFFSAAQKIITFITFKRASKIIVIRNKANLLTKSLKDNVISVLFHIDYFKKLLKYFKAVVTRLHGCNFGEKILVYNTLFHVVQL